MKNLKARINNLGLNYNREILKVTLPSIFLLIVGVITFILLKNYIYFLICIGIAIGFIFMFFYRYHLYEKEKNEKEITEFIELFSYLRIYISNRENVYVAINEIKEFASNETKERIERLLEDIDTNKTIAPFMKFAKYYNNRIIGEVMISLYESIDEGSNSLYINQFIKVFEEFKNNRAIDSKAKRYKSFDIFSTLSLLGSGVLMIILVIGVINLLGGMTENGF